MYTMKSLSVLLLVLTGCHGENFILKLVRRGLTAPLTGGGSEIAHESKRSQGLEVISAGLARTGSASLQKGLNILGYNSYHMGEVLANDHSALWDRVVDTNGKEGIKDVASAMIAAGYDATADSPCADFSMELFELYPKAKVILSTRPDDRWLVSVLQIPPILYVTSLPPWSYLPRFQTFRKMIENLHCQQWQGCLMCDGYSVDINDHETNDKCLGYLHSHIDKVKKIVPPEQLLEFHPSQGWEPICKFLDLPIPDEPFPHINGGLSFEIARYALWCVVVLYHGCCAAFVFHVIRKLYSRFRLRLKTKSL